MTPSGQVIVTDADVLADAAADVVAREAALAIATRGWCTIALSGGSTPRALYQRLSHRRDIEWSRIHLLWGDERCVPPTDPASNYGMARQALIDHIKMPAAQVHRIRGEDPPQAEAERYDSVVRSAVRDGAIDMVLLGLGTDGHTASLFPGDAATRAEDRWVVAAEFADARGWRISLTAPVLIASRTVLFLVAGADKAQVLADVLEGPDAPDALPAQRIVRGAVDVHWLVDREAASRLTQVPTAGR